MNAATHDQRIGTRPVHSSRGSKPPRAVPRESARARRTSDHRGLSARPSDSANGSCLRGFSAEFGARCARISRCSRSARARSQARDGPIASLLVLGAIAGHERRRGRSHDDARLEIASGRRFARVRRLAPSALIVARAFADVECPCPAEPRTPRGRGERPAPAGGRSPAPLLDEVEQPRDHQGHRGEQPPEKRHKAVTLTHKVSSRNFDALHSASKVASGRPQRNVRAGDATRVRGSPDRRSPGPRAGSRRAGRWPRLPRSSGESDTRSRRSPAPRPARRPWRGR